jgi:uncharacterized membrane protein
VSVVQAVYVSWGEHAFLISLLFAVVIPMLNFSNFLNFLYEKCWKQTSVDKIHMVLDRVRLLEVKKSENNPYIFTAALHG